MSENSRGAAQGRSTFEKRGGYAPKVGPVSKLPKVPSGPAPGAKPKKND